ncbi:hypothetical protein D3C86_1973420 [compost metagenome]
MDINDIDVTDGEPLEGYITKDLTSKTSGYLATIVDADSQWISMMLVSTLDHTTEPRTVEDYSIRRSNPTSDFWVLLWRCNDKDLLMGQVTNQEGAQRLLDYLKSNAQ